MKIKSLSPFLIENECKTLMGLSHLFSINNIFYDKIDLRPFYFDVTIYTSYQSNCTWVYLCKCHL